MTNRLVHGEIAISCLLNKTTLHPIGMLPLACDRLYPIDPTLPQEIDNIRLWQYTYGDGMVAQLPAISVVFATNCNLSSHIRGLSPFVTGVNAATVTYQALRYMKDFYTNNAVPSHIVVLQAGLSEKQRKDWESRYLEQYSNYNNMSQKVIVSSGTELDVKKLDTEQKTGEQINLLKYSDEQIAMLFGVPPTVMGNFQNVRFETSGIEREMFLEDAVLPLVEVTQDVLQHGIIERYFSLSDYKRGMGKKLTKNMKHVLDKHLSDTPHDINVILDTDSIPLMTQINIDKFNALETLCLKGRMSPNEAAELLNIELPPNPVRDRIFISKTMVEVNEDGIVPEPLSKLDEAQLQVESEVGVEHSNKPPQRTMHEVAKDEKVEKKVKVLHDQYRIIRKQVLINNQNNKVYSLRDIDALCGGVYGEVPSLKKEIRKDLYHLKRQVKGLESPDERATIIRKYYNGKKNGMLRDVVRKGIQGVFHAADGCCDRCAELDGEPYGLDEELPHPNCRCSVEVS